MIRLWSLGAALLVLASASPRLASAQPSTVFLVHGLNSDGPAWQSGANQLHAQFPYVQFIAPTLGAFQPFTTQAINLREAMIPHANPVAVGHSNGGTVIRTAAWTGQQLYGAITLGSPQLGAPLADRAIDGTLVGTLDYWWNGIISPIQVYGLFGFDMFSDYANFMANHLRIVVNPWMNILYTQYGINVITRRAEQTVVGSMGTGGWTNMVLNQPDNLAQESAGIPRRFSIAYRYHGPGLMFKGLTPQYHVRATNLQYMLYQIYASNYDAYQWYGGWDDPHDIWKRAYAYLWAAGAWQIATTDDMWCGLIDGWTSDGYCDSDGIVPAYSMYWPGATPAAVVSGLGHMEETSAPVSMGAVAGVLRSHVGLP